MSKKSELKKGVSLNYLLTLISNAAGFLLIPFMTSKMGDVGYGLYASIGGIAGYLLILDFGVNSTITRYIAKYRAESKEEKQGNFLALCLILYSALAVVVIAIGYFVWLKLPWVLQSMKTNEFDYLPQDIQLAKTMFAILLVNIAVSLPLRSFTAVMNGYEKFTFPRILNILRVIIRFAAIVIFLNFKFSIISIVIIDAVLNLGILIVNMFYVLLKLKVKILLEKFDLSFIREIFVFSLPIFLTMVYDQIFWKVDQTIILMILAAPSATVVSIAMNIVLIFMRFSTALSEVFLPRVTRMVENKATGSTLTDLMIKVGRVQFLVLGLILTGFIIFGQIFFPIYIGGQSEFIDANIQVIYYIGLIIMVPLTLPLIQNLGISILVAKNKHKFRSTVYFIIAVLNIGLTILLVKTYGIIGASIATAIALTIGNGIIINIYYSRIIGLKISKFFKDCVFKLLAPIVISSGFGYLIMRFLIFKNNWLNLLLCCLLYSVIYFTVMWIMGMNTYEKDMVKKVWDKITRRRAA